MSKPLTSVPLGKRLPATPGALHVGVLDVEAGAHQEVVTVEVRPSEGNG